MVHFMDTLDIKYNKFLARHDFFNVFRDRIRKTFDLFDQAKEQTDKERQSGEYGPSDFKTHTTYDCCIVFLVGAFEYFVKRIADGKNEPINRGGGNPYKGSQNLNTIFRWLCSSFNLRIPDLISDSRDRNYLKILFQYRHIIVHNAGLYDTRSIATIKPLYESIGWNADSLVENRSILWDPEHVEPMFRIIYELSGEIMEKLYPV